MKIDDLIDILQTLNGNDEIFIDIRYQPYAGARVDVLQYDIVDIMCNDDMTFSMISEYFRDKPEVENV